MALEVYRNASLMATREAQRRLGEPLQALLLALSFRDDLRELWSGRRDLNLGPLRLGEAQNRLGGAP